MFPQREHCVIFAKRGGGEGAFAPPPPPSRFRTSAARYRVRTTTTAKGVAGSAEVVTVPNAPLATAKRM